MHVRHLDNGQQRQQDKAHHGNSRQSKRLCEASPAEIWTKSCQSTTPVVRIHNIWMRARKKGLRVPH
jgi:hypothetical protein